MYISGCTFIAVTSNTLSTLRLDRNHITVSNKHHAYQHLVTLKDVIRQSPTVDCLQ